MKEKILEIIKKCYDPSDWDLTDINTAKAITSHVINFINWTNFEMYEFVATIKNDKCVYLDERPEFYGQEKHRTIETIYKYWLKNIDR